MNAGQSRRARIVAWLQLLGTPVIYLGPLPTEAAYAQAAPAVEFALPGQEHRELARLSGRWTVTRTAMGAQAATAGAVVRPILGGRFVEIDISGADTMFSTAARLALGFDRRHAVYQVMMMDTWGTYFITARGTPAAPAAMHGTDDDPVMRQMGLDKEFVITFKPERPDRFTIEVAFVDTRTSARTLIPAMALVFDRT